MTQLLGYLLISLPFITVFVMAWKSMGFLSACQIFGTAVLIILTVATGVVLIHG